MTGPPCPLCEGTGRVAGLRCRWWWCARKRRVSARARFWLEWALIGAGVVLILLAVILGSQ